MDDFKRFRYDFFGELLVSQEESSRDNEKNEIQKSHKNLETPNGNDNLQGHNQSEISEDSLMEFITDYFEGDVPEEFTIISQSIQENLDGQQRQFNEGIIPQTNAFECSSNSDANTSIELFTSPETSMINIDGICDADLLSPPQNTQPSSRRKSISYDIIFTNSKEQNGKVKLHIVPNQKTSTRDKNVNPIPPPSIPQPKTENQSVQQENISLRQRIQDLERKLYCLEIESERVVGELSRIIERKNETISQLELQIAGVRMEN